MKKLNKFIAGTVIVAAHGMTGIPVFASATEGTGEEAHSGMVVDPPQSNELLRKGTTVNVDGGTWNYGVGTTYVWSYYQHMKKWHKSSVKPGWFAQTFSSGWQRKGVRAKASAKRAKLGNQMFYDIQ